MHGGRGPRTCDGCDSCPRCDRMRVTLHDCPYGYCGGERLCPRCWGERRTELRTYHAEHCREAATSYARERALRAALLADGCPVRCAALAMPTEAEPDRVHVLFEAPRGGTIGFYMDAATYRAAGGGPATPETFAALGDVWAAPDDFQYEQAKADLTTAPAIFARGVDIETRLAEGAAQLAALTPTGGA